MSETSDPLEAELWDLRPCEVSTGLWQHLAERLADPVPAKLRRLWWPGLARGLTAACVVALLVAAVTAMTVWFLVPPGKHTAYVKLYMPIHVEGNVFDHPEGRIDFGSFQRTQFALLRSHTVLDAVLRDPKVQQLDLQGVTKGLGPVDWLEREIRVEFPDGPELPRVAMSGDDPEQLKVLVTAIADTYLEEVVNKQTASHRQARMDKLKGIRALYQQRLNAIRDTNRKLALAVGGNTDKLVELKQELSQKQLAAAKAQLTDVRGKLKELEVEAKIFADKVNAGAALQVSVKDIDARVDKDLTSELAALGKLRNDLAKEREKAADDDIPPIRRLRAAVEEKQAAIEAQRKALRPKYKEDLQNKAQSDAQSELTLTREKLTYYIEFEKALDKEVTELTKLNDKLNVDALNLEDNRTELQLAQNGYQKVAGEIDSLQMEMPAPARVRKWEDATVVAPDETSRRWMAGVGALGAFVAVLLLASL